MPMREYEFDNYYVDPETGERDRPEHHDYEAWFEVREIRKKAGDTKELYYHYSVKEREPRPYKSETSNGYTLNEYRWHEVARCKTYDQAVAIRDAFEAQVLDTHYTKEDQSRMYGTNKKLCLILRWRRSQYWMFKDAIQGYQVPFGSWNKGTYLDDRDGFKEKLITDDRKYDECGNVIQNGKIF